MSNIINLQINFDKNQLLKEVNSLPLKKNKSKVWKKIRDEAMREFFKESKTWYKYEIKNSSQYKEINRLYKIFKSDTIEAFKQLANSELPRHKDFKIKAAVNMLLSDEFAPITFDDEEVYYKNALINVSKHHSVKSYKKDRLLLKFGWTTKSFEQVYEELKCYELETTKSNNL